MSTPRKYIDSHWLVFAFQGVIALLFGWYIAFTHIVDTTTLVAIVSMVLLALGIIELVNLLRRTHLQETWGLTMAIAVMEIVVSVALLFVLNQNVAWQLGIIAVYTAIRGILEIILGLKSVDDTTDRTIWTICGICGAILGFVILNSGHLDPSSWIKAFGIYMVVFGMCSLIYGIHNRDQKHTAALERKSRASRKKTAKKRK